MKTRIVLVILEGGIFMNTELNLWLSNHLPGSEIKVTTSCGSLTVYLFQRSMDNLKGIFIRGNEINEHELHLTMCELISKFGPISIILNPEKFYILAQQYLPQGKAESTLDGRTISLQKLQPKNEKEQIARHFDLHRSNDITFAAAALRGLSFSCEKGQASVSQMNGEIEHNISLVNQLQPKVHGLASQFKNFEIPDNIYWHSDYKPAQPMVPIRNNFDTIIKIGSLAEFEKLFSGFGKFDKWDRNVFAAGCARDRDSKVENSYAVHKETGLLFYTGTYSEKSYRWEHAGYDIDILKEIGRSFEEAEKLIANEVKLKEERAKFEKILQNAEREFNQAKLGMSIQIGHAQWGQVIGHLENLAWNMQNGTAYMALRQVGLANELIMNIRLLSLGFSEFQKVQNSNGSYQALMTVGLSVATLQPILACVSIFSSMIGMLNSRQMPPALLQKDFFDVVNYGLFPLIEELRESIAYGQKYLANQIDNQTSTLLRMMNDCHQTLSQIIKDHGAVIKENFNTLAFDSFVEKAGKRASDYRKLLLEAKAFIKGGVVDENWFKLYCQHTSEALKKSKDLQSHGFNGTASTYTIECATKNPIYSTGIIHYKLWGDLDLPPDLSILYSASHTFILVAKTLLERERICGLYNSGKSLQLLELADKITKGLAAQKKLFDQLEPQLKKMLKSHKSFILWMKNNKATVEKARTAKKDKASDWVVNNSGKVLNNLVGQGMFHWNQFVDKSMNLQSYEKEMESIIFRRELANVLPLFDGDKRNPQIIANAKVITVSVKALLQLQKSTCSYKRWETKLNRRIWSTNETEFHSSVTMTVPSYIPLATIFVNSEAQIGEEVSSIPKKPLFDCTITYYGCSNKFETEFSRDSHLQRKDIEGIKAVSQEVASKRELLMRDVMRFFTGTAQNNPEFSNFKDRFETCLHMDGSMPPLPLPKTLMENMRQFLCPSLVNLTMTGAIVDLKYDFCRSTKGDIYQLKLHAVYGETEIPFISCCICEFDETTVEAYGNIAEFLYCSLFSLKYAKDEGIPGSDTYSNKKEGIIAPVLENFPGIFYILEEDPHLCFTFDHTKYKSSTTDDLWNWTIKTKFDENIRKQFFKNGEIRVHEANFMNIQGIISQRKEVIEKSHEYKEFKEDYDTFMALSKLVCNLDKKKVHALLSSNAGIALPGEVGWLEQAYYWTAPSKEKSDEISSALKINCSPARTSLESYQERVSSIYAFLDKFKGSEFVPMFTQKEFAASLRFEGKSGARADLAKDTYQKSLNVSSFKKIDMKHLPKIQTLNVEIPLSYVWEKNKAIFSEAKIPGLGDCGFLATNTTRKEVIDYLLSHSNEKRIRDLVAPEVINWLKSEAVLDALPANANQFMQQYNAEINLKKIDDLAPQLFALAGSKDIFEFFINSYYKNGYLNLIDYNESGVISVIAEMKCIQIRVWQPSKLSEAKLMQIYGIDRDKEHTIDILYYHQGSHFNKLLLSQIEYAKDLKKYKIGDGVVISQLIR